MFQSTNVEVYLKSAVLDTDGDKRIAKAKFFITPIEYELACEISYGIADRLFTGKNGDRAPSQEMTKADFVMSFPRYSMEFTRDPGYSEKHTLIPDVSITSLSAQKLFADKSDFSLIFTASFEIGGDAGKTIVRDLIDLLHEKLFITFRASQGELFEKREPVMDLACRLCGKENPEWATTDNKFAYCEAHNANIQEGERLKRIRDTAAARSLMREPGDEPEQPHTDPLRDEAEFINQRGRRKKAR
ncbi:MAG TPA: hypothetical protein VIY07_09555 [Pseudolabrys sp.]